MSIDQYGYKDSIDMWADIWEKAQKDGIFDDAPKAPVPASQTSDNSFFGLSQSNSGNDLNNVDTDYWKQVYDLSAQGRDHDEIMQEMLKPDTNRPLVTDKEELGKMTSRMAASPNPIPAWTVGPDSQPLPGETAPSYTEEDLNKLSTLKGKLHDLQDKVATLEAKGEKAKKFDEQMSSLMKQIDALSDLVAGTFSTAPNGGK